MHFQSFIQSLRPIYLDLTVVLEGVDPTVTSSSLWITIVHPQVVYFN